MRARGEATRRAVLRAAEAVFSERGYAGARMDDVAERVGIRRASMVYYFRDKRSLYLALLDDLFGDLQRRYEAALAGSGSVGDRFLRCVDVWVKQVTERPAFIRLTLWELARSRATSAAPYAERLQPVLAALAAAVTEGHRSGEFRHIEPLRLLMTVAGATTFLTLGMLTLAPEGALPTEDALREELCQLVQRLLFVD